MSKFNAIASLADGFNKGYDTVGKVAQDWEIANIANAQVKQTGAVEPNPGEVKSQLDAGAGMGEAKTLAGGRVPQKYEYLGKSYDAAPTDQERQLAQTMAMAKVVQKYDPVKGLTLANSAMQGQREQERFGMEQKRFGREETKANREEEDAKLFKDIEQRTGDWVKARVTNADGSTRPVTADDHLEAANYRVGQLMQAGKTDEAMKRMGDVNAAAFTKIQLETAERDKAIGAATVALQSGDTSKMVDFYNRFVPDSARVTNIQRGPKGEYLISRETTDGQKLPVVNMGDINQFTSTLAMFKDPKALYQFQHSERMFRLQEKQTNASVGLHAAQTEDIQAKTGERVELSKIHTNLSNAIESGDKKAEDVERRKLETYLRQGKGGNVMTALEKEANLNLASGRAKTMVEAIEMAKQKTQKSPADTYIEFRSKQLTPEEINNEMSLLHGENWRQKVQSASGLASGIASRPSQDAAIQEARKAIANGASSDAVKKRLQSMGYDTKGL